MDGFKMKNAIDRVSEPRKSAFLGFNLGDRMARPLQSWFRWKFHLLLLGFLASLCLFWPIGYQAQAILINDNLVAAFPTLRPNIPVYQQGDIAYADVTLDGYVLFPVTAPISPDKPEVGQSNLRIRVGSIESSLYRVVSRNIDPDELYVVVASLDKQTVILAGTQNQSTQEILLTVTELDAQLAQQSIPVLAQNWTDIIHKALQQAWEARSPVARRHQMLQAVGLLASIFAISLGLSAIRRWLYRLFKRRKQHIHDLPSSGPPDPNTHPEDSAAELVRDFHHSLAQKQRQRLNIWLSVQDKS